MIVSDETSVMLVVEPFFQGFIGPQEIADTSKSREVIVGLSAESREQVDDLLAELARRGAIRSGNNPVADYAELLVANYYGIEVQPQSTKGYDVLTPDDERIQVKALRRTQRGRSNLSRIGDLDGDPGFDAIVIVVFTRAA
jgi:predicted lactoylglutathione lyase